MMRDDLEQRIRQGILLSAITAKGGRDKNINFHGTAFAGSLYAVATLEIWGLVNSCLPAHASLVMAEDNIQYRKPVVGDIVAHCETAAEQMEAFLKSVNENGKGRLTVIARITGDDDPAEEFTGHVYARLKR